MVGMLLPVHEILWRWTWWDGGAQIKKPRLRLEGRSVRIFIFSRTQPAFRRKEESFDNAQDRGQAEEPFDNAQGRKTSLMHDGGIVGGKEGLSRKS